MLYLTVKILIVLSSMVSTKPAMKIFIRRGYAILFTLFLTATTAEASYAKLAKDAGLSHKTMKEIVKKVVKVETTTGNYHTKNRKSGAYGRYQIMPKTAASYAKKLKIPKSKWKIPHNQDSSKI